MPLIAILLLSSQASGQAEDEDGVMARWLEADDARVDGLAHGLRVLPLAGSTSLAAPVTVEARHMVIEDHWSRGASTGDGRALHPHEEGTRKYVLDDALLVTGDARPDAFLFAPDLDGAHVTVQAASLELTAPDSDDRATSSIGLSQDGRVLTGPKPPRVPSDGSHRLEVEDAVITVTGDFVLRLDAWPASVQSPHGQVSVTDNRRVQDFGLEASPVYVNEDHNWTIHVWDAKLTVVAQQWRDFYIESATVTGSEVRAGDQLGLGGKRIAPTLQASDATVHVAAPEAGWFPVTLSPSPALGEIAAGPAGTGAVLVVAGPAALLAFAAWRRFGPGSRVPRVLAHLDAGRTEQAQRILGRGRWPGVMEATRDLLLARVAVQQGNELLAARRLESALTLGPHLAIGAIRDQQLAPLLDLPRLDALLRDITGRPTKQ